MSTSRSLKLLLVEDDLDDQLLLAEALLEIEDNRQWCNWNSASVLHVGLLADALDSLQHDCFDAILLNLSLPDNPVLLDSFYQVNACARTAPIIVLADVDDENLANRLLREGAQDVLQKSELDCAMLARSLRYAVERQLRTTMLGSSPLTDSLTGILSTAGFYTIATHSFELSRLTRLPLLMASAEISEPLHDTPEDREARELLLLRAAETLTAAFQPPALIGRLGRSRFGLLTAALTETTLEALLNRAALAIETAARSGGGPSVTVRFSVWPVNPDASLDQLLGEINSGLAHSTHRRAKTVMLAD